MVRLLGIALACAAIGCGGDGALAFFDVDGERDEFYALPFPNDLRLESDGTADLSDHPRPNDLTEIYVDRLDAEVIGFSPNPVGFFRFDGAIDVGSLPADPATSLEAGASVYLVGIDPDSLEYGRRVPAHFRFEQSAGSVIGDNWLAVQTFPGFALEPGTTYAFVVTDRVTSDGNATTRDAGFQAAMSGELSGTGADSYAALVDFLESAESPDGPGDVVSAAVFTTQDVPSLLRAARDVVRAQVSPEPRELEFVTNNSSYAQYRGLYDAPNFQEGDPPYRRVGGAIETDEAGVPLVQRSEEIRFTITVPVDAPPAGGWPVVLYAHGTGGSYTSFVTNGTARRLADVGIAAISIDQVLHGPRDPTSSSPDLNFFNLLNPNSARDNTLQGAIDLMSLTRLAEVLDFDDPGEGYHLIFDPEHIMFFGHSQGGITGAPFLGTEDNVKGGILSGSGGLISRI